MGKKLAELAQNLAGQAGGGILNAGMGLLLEKHNDKRQLKQQKKLQELEIAGNRNLTQFSHDLQMEMWNKTNYPAQMEMLKKAGLNPALLYGMGGGGGATVGGMGATSVSGADAPRGGGEAMGMMLAGQERAMQLKLLKAQKENIEADTANKLGDAANKPITGKNIEADTENKILDSVIKKYTGKEAQDTYEKVTSPARGVQAKTYEDELAARQGIAGTIYELWTEGKLHDKSVNEIEQILLQNEKLKGETRNIIKSMDLLEENIKGAKLDNIIREIETKMQQETGIDRNAPTWLKIIGRLFGNILNPNK